MAPGLSLATATADAWLWLRPWRPRLAPATTASTAKCCRRRRRRGLCRTHGLRIQLLVGERPASKSFASGLGQQLCGSQSLLQGRRETDMVSLPVKALVRQAPIQQTTDALELVQAGRPGERDELLAISGGMLAMLRATGLEATKPRPRFRGDPETTPSATSKDHLWSTGLRNERS